MSLIGRNGCPGVVNNICLPYILIIEFHIGGNNKARSSHVRAMLSDKRAYELRKPRWLLPHRYRYQNVPRKVSPEATARNAGSSQATWALCYRIAGNHGTHTVSYKCNAA